MHGAAARAHRTFNNSATRAARPVAPLEDGRANSGGDAGKPLSLCGEEGEGEEEDDQLSLVPLALEQHQTLTAMVTRLVNQR
jgi:hypothetical protein